MPAPNPLVNPSPGMESHSSLPAPSPSPLLIDEPPLQVLPSLAVALGLNEAIFVQQLHYWLRRAPHWREGRPWVYNSYPQWHRQFPFWDERTIKRIVLGLEGAGIVTSTQRYNASPTDRTKWYTLNYGHAKFSGGAPAAESGSPPGQLVPMGASGPRGQIVPMDREAGKPMGTGCPDGHDKLPPSSGQVVPMMGTGDPHVNQRLRTEITTETMQQQHAAPPPATGGSPPPDDVVVVHAPQLIQALMERGVTAGVARHLVADHAPAVVARQVAHYDHERAADPADPRLTPGRLRRRIEGDWAPPPGFVPAAEREHRAAQEERQRADARAARAAEDERCRREHTATLAAVRATIEDQATWHALVGNPTPLPVLFRGALFRAPREGTPPVIILRTPEECARAVSGSHAKERQELERRLRARYPTYERAALVGKVGTLYAAYDEYAAEFARKCRCG